MRRLLSPVNVGVSAARHVLWYLSYHAAPAPALAPSSRGPGSIGSRPMGIIAWILLGLFAGTIARAVIPGRTEPGGCIGTTAVGILGALIGGFLASALDIGHIDDFFDLGTWLIAIGGSVHPAADHPRDRALIGTGRGESP